MSKIEDKLREIKTTPQYTEFIRHMDFVSKRFRDFEESIKLLTYHLILEGQFEDIAKSIPGLIFEKNPVSIDDFFNGPYGDNFNRTLKPIWKREILDFFKLGSPYEECIFTGCAGSGKAQPLYSKIKTPTGWTTMGEIKVGDIVDNAVGGITTVTNIFPQGKKDIYRVTFEDGRYTDCCKEHLWEVKDKTDNKFVIQLKDIIDNGFKNYLLPEISTGKFVYHNIKSVELIGNEECQCIMVDSPEHLYVTDDFIVTHNSTIARYLILYTLYKICCLRHPQATFGLSIESPLSIVFLSTTLDMARKLSLQPFAEVMANCPAFERVKSTAELYKYQGTRIPYVYTDSDSIIRLNNNISITVGSGLAQPLYSKIKTPTGWTTMGEIKVGDIVDNAVGGTTVVTNIFPQGKKDIYRVTFEDGRYTDCCKEHLWNVSYEYRKNKTINTEEIIRLLNLKTYKNKLYVQLYKQNLINNEDKNLSINPYLLGALIGDGGLTRDYIGFTTSDYFLSEKINELLPGNNLYLRKIPNSKYDFRISKITGKKVPVINQYNEEFETATLAAEKYNGDGSSIIKCCLGKIKYSGIHPITKEKLVWKYSKSDGCKNILKELLIELDLMGKYSYEKHIPTEYLNASYNQRVELLQGLMDTDGTVDKQGTLQYCTTSERLAKDVQYLVRSLGGLCKISTKSRKNNIPGEINGRKVISRRDLYVLNIRYKTPSIFFSLPRKLERCNNNNQYSENLSLRIKSVELIGNEECQCIMVDSPEHLYVTDDFIVTHNTHILGMNVIACFLDEAELGTNTDDTLNLYAEVGMRIQSRFKSNSFTFKALISSAGMSDGVIAQYIKKFESDIGKSIKLCSYAIWEMNPDIDPYANGYFYVFGGTSIHPSRVLEDEEAEQFLSGEKDIPTLCDITKVPLMYKNKFLADTEKMLRDVCGRSTQVNEILFPDLSSLEDYALCPLLVMECSVNKRIRLSTQLPAELFKTGADGRKVLARNPKAPRYVALDLSLNKGSETAIVLLHKEIDPEDGGEMYIVDLLMSLTTQDKIDLSAIPELIEDFKFLYSINIEEIVLDQWQTESFIQYFERKALARKITKRSTTSSMLPIRTISNLIAQNKIKVGSCKKLKKQMSNISVFANNSSHITYKHNKKQGVFDLVEVLINGVYAAFEDKVRLPTNTYQGGDYKNNSVELMKDKDFVNEIISKFGVKIK